MSDNQTKPRDYRRRAIELRRVAANMTDPGSCAIVMAMADDYQRLAEVLERTSAVRVAQLSRTAANGKPSPSA